MRAGRERRGVTLLEILVALAVLGVAFLPVARLLTASTVTGQSAHRLLTAALHARALAETAVQLDARELPVVEAGGQLPLGEAELAATAQLAGLGASAPDFISARRLVLKRLDDGTLLAQAEVEWDAVPGDRGTRQRVSMVASGEAGPD